MRMSKSVSNDLHKFSVPGSVQRLRDELHLDSVGFPPGLDHTESRNQTAGISSSRYRDQGSAQGHWYILKGELRGHPGFIYSSLVASV